VDPNELVPRRVGEVIGSTVGTLATIVNYPIGNVPNSRISFSVKMCKIFNSNTLSKLLLFAGFLRLRGDAS